MSARIAGRMEWPAAQIELLRRAAPLHDVGKIGVSAGLLRKSGPLTEEEFEQIKLHTTIGARILSGSRIGLLEMAADIALSHHEHWDGGGYPRGLRGAEISIGGRILAAADAFDALASKRAYREPMSPEATIGFTARTVRQNPLRGRPRRSAGGTSRF